MIPVPSPNVFSTPSQSGGDALLLLFLLTVVAAVALSFVAYSTGAVRSAIGFHRVNVPNEPRPRDIIPVPPPAVPTRARRHRVILLDEPPRSDSERLHNSGWIG